MIAINIWKVFENFVDLVDFWCTFHKLWPKLAKSQDRASCEP